MSALNIILSFMFYNILYHISYIVSQLCHASYAGTVIAVFANSNVTVRVRIVRTVVPVIANRAGHVVLICAHANVNHAGHVWEICAHANANANRAIHLVLICAFANVEITIITPYVGA